MTKLPTHTAEFEPLLVGAAPDFTTHTVTLKWQNGTTSIADFSHLMNEGVFKAFSSVDFFNRVELKHNGRALAWANGIDFDSLLLWYTANPDDVPVGLRPHIPSKSRFAPKSEMLRAKFSG